MTKKLAQTVVREQYMVSTVLLILGEYETMVFNYDAEAGKVTDWLELDCLRSMTESEAFADHTSLVIKWGAPA